SGVHTGTKKHTATVAIYALALLVQGYNHLVTRLRTNSNPVPGKPGSHRVQMHCTSALSVLTSAMGEPGVAVHKSQQPLWRVSDHVRPLRLPLQWPPALGAARPVCAR